MTLYKAQKWVKKLKFSKNQDFWVLNAFLRRKFIQIYVFNKKIEDCVWLGALCLELITREPGWQFTACLQLPAWRIFVLIGLRCGSTLCIFGASFDTRNSSVKNSLTSKKIIIFVVTDIDIVGAYKINFKFFHNAFNFDIFNIFWGHFFISFQSILKVFWKYF